MSFFFGAFFAFLRKEGARVRIAGCFGVTNADDDETVQKRLRWDFDDFDDGEYYA